MKPRHLLPLAAAPALLAACAPQGSFPSLAPRLVERQHGGGPPTTGPCAVEGPDGCYEAGQAAVSAPTADDPALRSRITELSAQASAGQRAFAERVSPASAAAERAGAEGSDSWIGAQQELSRLEAARAQTADAATALDALVLARAGQATSEADLKLLTDAAAAARRLADAQDAEVERLRAHLSAR